MQGKSGEDLAAKELEKRGFQILARNVRFRFGELDVVAKREHILHFFEVKVRGKGSRTIAREALTRAQQGRIRRAAALYLRKQERQWKGAIPPAQFGVVAIDVDAFGQPTVEIVEDAFS